MWTHPLFQSLDEKEKELFIKQWTKKSIKKGDILLKENKPINKAFILVEGKLSAIKETLYGDDYVTTILEDSDEIFGDINLIDKGNAISTIKAETDCIILEIDYDTFHNFLNNNPLIGYKVLLFFSKNLAKHLRKADKDVVTLFNALVEVVEND